MVEKEEGIQTAEPTTRSERKTLSIKGTETVLLVEDDGSVRELAKRVLEHFGYAVLAAGNGEEAEALCDRYEGTIHLLLTDVIMPGASGREVAERLCADRPGMKVLYMSGYTDDALGPHGVLSPEIPLLEKPFTAEGLARKVREALEAPTDGTP